jgi:DNA-binding GntR family transcriptional regulator
VTVTGPAPSSGFVKPPTAQEAVLAELRRAIGTGELRPGEQVRQDSLAERFGVSRVPLREALKILEGEGQVVYLPHRGYFVAELDVDDLREVYRIRDLLESEAVRVAVPQLTASDLDRLADACDDVDQAAANGDLAAMTEANRRFHFTLIEAARMPRLARLIRILWDATDAYRSVYYSEPGNRSHVHDEHAAVITALRELDAERAVTVLREHRERAVHALVEELGDASVR